MQKLTLNQLNHDKQQQSRSGPQTPASGHHARHPRKPHESQHSPSTTDDEHQKRCVFSKLLSRELEDAHDEHLHGRKLPQNQSQQHSRNRLTTGSLDRSAQARLADRDAVQLYDNEHEEQLELNDPHKQYVAVQQGRDIPLRGLRKPAPQPNVYKGKALSFVHLIPTLDALCFPISRHLPLALFSGISLRPPTLNETKPSAKRQTKTSSVLLPKTKPNTRKTSLST